MPRGWAGWLAALARLTLICLLLMAITLIPSRMPGVSYSGPLAPLSGAERSMAQQLSRHVHALAEEIGVRNIWRHKSMAKTVAYLEGEFAALGYAVRRLPYEVDGIKGTNLEVEIGGGEKSSEIVLVGAHYDTVAGCPGANDNGSGLAVLLELARLLAGRQPQRTIRLVAFANEEAPFFRGQAMGSGVYARAARKQGEDIRAMLALETMGYYSDEPASQHYPFPLGYFYPDRANFIAFVGNIGSRQLVRQTIGAFRRHGQFPSEGLAAPAFVTGVSWSDHRSFWQQGYPAIMVTDTAFYRYSAYHSPQDTAEKLDYERLARVVSGLGPTILELAATSPEGDQRRQEKSRGNSEAGRGNKGREGRP
ncbi:MAG: M28 family peptidase [Thermodesulfobacteriota bacterium]